MSNQPKERSVLFNGEMVRAVMDGQQTLIWQVVEPQPPEWVKRMTNTFLLKKSDADFAAIGKHPEFGEATIHPYTSPLGRVGDLLWVRETWAADVQYDALKPSLIPSHPVYYKADGPYSWENMWGHWNGFGGKTRPSTHMPRWASRLTLRIINVRVKQVQDIGEESARALGLECSFSPDLGRSLCIDKWTHDVGYWEDPVDALGAMWDSANKESGYGWNKNPWAWLYEFELCS